MEGLPPNWDTILQEGAAYAPGEIPPLRMFKYVSPGTCTEQEPGWLQAVISPEPTFMATGGWR